MKTEIPQIVGPEFLMPIMGCTLSTIKVYARSQPEKLPPRFRIPGSNRIRFAMPDVLDWVEKCREKPPEPEPVKVKTSIFKGRKARGVAA